MPLPDPAPRQHLHTRRVTCTGYRREDGLLDVEGHMTDTKTYGFENSWRGTIEPGTPIHEMWLRITVDDELRIHAVEAVTDHSPFRICPDIAPAYQRLVGLRIRPGFTKAVRDLLGGAAGCTHLTELLGPVATTAFQTLAGRRGTKPGDQQPARRPSVIDTCHALAADGDVVREHWPAFYTGAVPS